MLEKSLRQTFHDYGYVVIRGLLAAPEVSFYIERLEELAGIHRGDFKLRRLGHRSSDPAARKSWTLPGGVSKREDFWPLSDDPRVLAAVRILLGPDIRYLHDSALHAGCSTLSWQRDCVNRSLGLGPDWDETREPYQLVRVGLYLQLFEESGFRLGFIPGSNRLAKNRLPQHKKFSEARLKWLSAARPVGLTFQRWASGADWIATQPGDCIIFDPRILHAGGAVLGSQYSIFLAYGIENEHFRHHQVYLCRMRQEMQQENLSPKLVQRLKCSGIYAGPSFTHENVPAERAPTPRPVFLSESFKMQHLAYGRV